MTLHSCAECDGFIPNEQAGCPHCGATPFAVANFVSVKNGGGLARFRRTLLATAAGSALSATLMACYGAGIDFMTCVDNGGTDLDGDGYCAEVNDCNDFHPNIHPGAMEMSGDDIDSDCDGLVDPLEIVDAGIPRCVDEGGRDFDGDGFCDGAGDCDDFDASINVAAFETTGDEIDSDCDGYDDPHDDSHHGDDAGMSNSDAGTSPDAGLNEFDAGTFTDAGTDGMEDETPLDAGMSQ